MPQHKIYSFTLILGLLFLNGCTSKPSTGQDYTENKTIRSYQIKVVPDSAIFGDQKEIILSVKNVTAKEVKHFPERDTSIEITYDLEVTNNNKIGGNYIFVDPGNFRLVLNNSRKLTHAFYNALGADPQSTTISVGNIFNLPAKTKPVALNLFFADSTASLKILLK